MKPIISVHEHIFNARDIPIKGYLKSRKYKGLLKYLAKIFIPSVAKCLRKKLDPEKKITRVRSGWCRFVMWVVEKSLGKPYRSWGDTLSQKVTDITAEMVNTFSDDNINLYVPLMIDYEYWFENTPDKPISKQIDDILNNIILPYKGLIHLFVPFDPARELAFRKELDNPDGNPEKYGSLNLVKKAIEEKGFIGVKLYNAMGYRPYNNALVDEKRRKIALHKKRYLFYGQEYDKVLSELYDYCVENEVPIITHCGMDGSESYHDASFDFGHPIFWRDVLDQEQWSKLRLNLAHFGWNKDQFHQGMRSWVKEICEMLGKYENLYTDVSHHEVVVPGNAEKFKSAYKELCQKYPVIKKKLLFGIDWHVIKRVEDFKTFKTDYINILKHNNLFNQSEIDDFLGGNAVRFLGMLTGNKNRQRLIDFYNTQGINIPQWLK